MKLREFKHSYGACDRILTLLLLESAEPRHGSVGGRTGRASTASISSCRTGSCRISDRFETNQEKNMARIENHKYSSIEEARQGVLLHRPDYQREYV